MGGYASTPTSWRLKNYTEPPSPKKYQKSLSPPPIKWSGYGGRQLAILTAVEGGGVLKHCEARRNWLSPPGKKIPLSWIFLQKFRAGKMFFESF